MSRRVDRLFRLSLHVHIVCLENVFHVKSGKRTKTKKRGKKYREEGREKTIIESDINWFCISISSTALVYFTFRSSRSLFLSFICPFSSFASQIFVSLRRQFIARIRYFGTTEKCDTKGNENASNKSIYCQFDVSRKSFVCSLSSFRISRKKFIKTDVYPGWKYSNTVEFSMEMIPLWRINITLYSQHYLFVPLKFQFFIFNDQLQRSI